MQKLLATTGVFVALTLSAANAATIGFTEGQRPTVPGTTLVGGDAAQTPPGFDLSDGFADGSLDAGDRIELFGRIVGALDNYNFDAGNGFTFDLIGNGIAHEAGGTPNTVVFTFTNQVTTEVFEFITDTTSSLGTIGILTAGSYLLEVDMDPDNGTAQYDIALNSVPVPAALPLFAAGLAGIGAMRRKKRAQA